ncbi:RNA-directed DNA polymerase, eukaryota [Tanacetum coccineum]
MEKSISRDEIRNAVCACGENKSPGPYGFTFEFFRKFWNIIGPDLCVAVEWFFDHSLFTRGCNSSFISLIPKVQDPKFVNDYRPISLIGSLYKVVTKILATRLSFIISDLISDVQTAFLPNRQILDGPFIINELLSWCKHKKQQTMVFKVDFAKTYDSIRWDYLDDLLQAFGFGSRWRSWINGSLSSGKASILINGSPTFEFQFHCGLKQGDPLAPYLFILIMESLHLSFSRIVEAGIFKGIKIDNSVTISHLFYADDAMSKEDLSHLLFSCSMATDVVRLVCRWRDLGWMPLGSYSDWLSWFKSIRLGSKPKGLVEGVFYVTWWSLWNFRASLCCNSLMESIRRKFFNGIHGDEKKVTWVKWSKVLAAKKHGGLGVSRLFTPF